MDGQPFYLLSFLRGFSLGLNELRSPGLQYVFIPHFIFSCMNAYKGVTTHEAQQQLSPQQMLAQIHMVRFLHLSVLLA